jgi:hypothetical protein
MNSHGSEKALVTRVNATTLVRCIVQGVIGNDLADMFARTPLTNDVIDQLAQARFQGAVQQYL